MREDGSRAQVRLLFWSARRRKWREVFERVRAACDADIYLFSEIRAEGNCDGALLSAPTGYLPPDERKLAVWARHPIAATETRSRLLVFRCAGLTCAAIVPPYRGYAPRRLPPWEGYRRWWSEWPADGFAADLVIGDFNTVLSGRPRSLAGRLPYDRLGSGFAIHGVESGRLDYVAVRDGLTAEIGYRTPPDPYLARDDRKMLLADVCRPAAAGPHD